MLSLNTHVLSYATTVQYASNAAVGQNRNIYIYFSTFVYTKMSKNNLYYRILKINKDFGFKPINTSSLSFACAIYGNTKNNFKKCAALIRAIALDHPFEDRNKSTTTVIVRDLLSDKYVLNEQALCYLIKDVIINNKSNLEYIEMRLRRCCQKKK